MFKKWKFNRSYTCTKKEGRVTMVQPGEVYVNSTCYKVRVPLVSPGWYVTKGQPIGKK